jgi:hypothetical protein
MFIAVATLAFGAVFLVATIYSAGRKYISGHIVFELVGFIFILSMAVFILAVGYNEAQMAPVFGLMGTIAGYLFGHESKAGPAAPASNIQPSTPPTP